MLRYRTSVTANMNLIGERFFWYRYRIIVVCSVTGAVDCSTSYSFCMATVLYIGRDIEKAAACTKCCLFLEMHAFFSLTLRPSTPPIKCPTATLPLPPPPHVMVCAFLLIEYGDIVPKYLQHADSCTSRKRIRNPKNLLWVCVIKNTRITTDKCFYNKIPLDKCILRGSIAWHGEIHAIERVHAS